MTTHSLDDAKDLILWAKANGVSRIAFGEPRIEVEFRDPAVDPTKPIPVIEAPKDLADALSNPAPVDKPVVVKGGRYDGIPEDDLFAAAQGVG